MVDAKVIDTFPESKICEMSTKLLDLCNRDVGNFPL
jgi:hypothetical protein